MNKELKQEIDMEGVEATKTDIDVEKVEKEGE